MPGWNFPGLPACIVAVGMLLFLGLSFARYHKRFLNKRLRIMQYSELNIDQKKHIIASSYIGYRDYPVSDTSTASPKGHQCEDDTISSEYRYFNRDVKKQMYRYYNDRIDQVYLKTVNDQNNNSRAIKSLISDNWSKTSTMSANAYTEDVFTITSCGNNTSTISDIGNKDKYDVYSDNKYIKSKGYGCLMNLCDNGDMPDNYRTVGQLSGVSGERRFPVISTGHFKTSNNAGIRCTDELLWLNVNDMHQTLV